MQPQCSASGARGVGGALQKSVCVTPLLDFYLFRYSCYHSFGDIMKLHNPFPFPLPIILAAIVSLSGCRGAESKIHDWSTRLIGSIEERISSLSDPVLARVDGSTISASDLKRSFQSLRADRRRDLASPKGRRILLDILIKHRLVLQAARTWARTGDAASNEPYTAQQEERLYHEYLLFLRATKFKTTEDELHRFYDAHRLISRDGEIQSPPRPYDQVKEEIRLSLEQQKYTQWVAELRSHAEIRIDERKLDLVDLSRTP